MKLKELIEYYNRLDKTIISAKNNLKEKQNTILKLWVELKAEMDESLDSINEFSIEIDRIKDEISNKFKGLVSEELSEQSDSLINENEEFFEKLDFINNEDEELSDQLNSTNKKIKELSNKEQSENLTETKNEQNKQKNITVFDNKDNRFELNGNIDENSELGDVFNNKLPIIYLNMDNVPEMSSAGIKKWLSFVSGCTKTINFTNCSANLFNLFCSKPELLGANGTIESFYSVFTCEKCDKKTSILVNIQSDDSDYGFFHDEMLCSDCEMIYF